MRKSFSKSSLKKLETLFMLLGFTVRYEKGQFKSGYCIVKDRNIVVLNKFFETKERIKILDSVLESIPLNNIDHLDDKNRQYLKDLRSDVPEPQLILPLAS